MQFFQLFTFLETYRIWLLGRKV